MLNFCMRSDWKEIPLEHYTALFARLDPSEAAARCNLSFNAERSVFFLRYMADDYAVSYPEFDVSGPQILNVSEKILILRYLCEGRWSAPSKKTLSYREIPWGEVYFKNFEGRCIARLARSFGSNPALFTRIMETPALNAQRTAHNHPAYRFEFMSNLSMSFLIWSGDDEFPPSAQIMFDDNVPLVFSAEDLAVLCECVIARLQIMRRKIDEGTIDE